MRNVVAAPSLKPGRSLLAGLGLGVVVVAHGGVDAQSRGVAEAGFVEQDDAAVIYRGAWFTNSLASHSGGSARLSMDAAGQVSFTFRGRSVRWIGYRDEWSGIANVSLDGVRKATVDGYAASAQPQATLYEVDGLPAGAHTLTIQPTGSHSQASRGAWIWVDGFAVGGPTALPPPVSASKSLGQPAPSPSRAARARSPALPAHGDRVEQDQLSVSYVGAWSSNAQPAHSGGSAALSMDPGSEASLAFEGSGVLWIGYCDEWSGIANVVLDGEKKGAVDTYCSPARAQATLYSIRGLPRGAHTLAIQVTGTRREPSAGSWVWVDCFWVIP